MITELETAGVEINYVGINKIDAESTQQHLIDLVDFTLFQDVAGVGAWEAMDGHKDDVYLYDAQGILLDYFGPSDPRETNLSIEAGYAALKSAIENSVE
jgi:hypothetical protein